MNNKFSLSCLPFYSWTITNQVCFVQHVMFKNKNVRTKQMYFSSRNVAIVEILLKLCHFSYLNSCHPNLFFTTFALVTMSESIVHTIQRVMKEGFGIRFQIQKVANLSYNIIVNQPIHPFGLYCLVEIRTACMSYFVLLYTGQR